MSYKVKWIKALNFHRFTLRNIVFLALLSTFAFLPSVLCQTKKLKVVEYFHSGSQHFYCTAGYIAADCTQQLSVLRQFLERYNAGDLGEWHWILVSRTQWKPLLLDIGFRPLSPAITSFEDRQTLFDESLFSCDAQRSSELLHEFQVPLDKLLNIAITHELGHAVCRDGSEAHAESFAQQLRRGGTPRCTRD